jgi:hypothetical protein
MHVPIIENAIKHIKNVMRCIIPSLPYTCPKIMVIYLVHFAVNRLNMRPEGTRTDNISTLEVFKGRRLSMKKDVGDSFGSYAQISNTQMNNTMAARTTGAILLGPTMNGTGTFKFLSLKIFSIVMANHFKILPIPSEVIVYVNALSVKDNIKYDKREPIFTFHDKVVDDNIDKDETTPILLQPQLHQDPVGAAARALAADRIGILDQPQIEDQNSPPGQLDLRGELEDDHAEAGQPTELGGDAEFGGVGGDTETQDNYEIAVELDDIASPAPPS